MFGGLHIFTAPLELVPTTILRPPSGYLAHAKPPPAEKAGGVGVVARFMGGSCPSSVVMVALATLCDACRNHERNRDAFIYTNMAQVRLSLLEAVLRFGVTPDPALNSTEALVFQQRESCRLLLQCRKAI